jgi:hypothetical protein
MAGKLVAHLRGRVDLREPMPALLLVLALFWICALRHAEAPGLYMDAINPDYLVARWLNPELANPVWILPGPQLPLLGNLYHGTQNLYLGLLTYGVFGTSVFSARLTHGLFGAAIVALLYLVVRRAVGRPYLALLAACGLATDMAFIGSFRTQSYIVLGGQVWMLSAFSLALGLIRRKDAGTWGVVASGACMGLAAYGYFVHLFFAPVVALLAVLGPGPQGSLRRAALWFAGFVAGMSPYIVGYVWAIAELGGWAPFVEWLQAALAGLKPMQGSPGYVAGLGIAFRDTRLALAGIGNEMMMTGGAVSSLASVVRTVVLSLGCVICLATAALQWRVRPANARVSLAVAMLPFVYCMVAAIFGGRLWVHHYTVLVAIGYLVLAVALAALAEMTTRIGAKRAAATALMVVLLGCNIAQQNRVFDELDRTGGVGKSTEMLDMLSRAALAERHEAAYYFPDWGFFMPFAFLTGNRVNYELELSSAALGRHRGTLDEVRVAFWESNDRARYEAVLRGAGVKEIQLYTFAQRNGEPAFYLLAGRM